PVTYDKTTQYQFMSGEWMLIAPVYSSQYERDSIYFPEGKWIDYWNGDLYSGPAFQNDYAADINTCPVFIKEGAIIPMYPEMLYDNQLPKDPLTFDVYPSGYSSFVLYEDDGISREHRTGAYSKTLVESQGPAFGEDGTVTLTVNEYLGEYAGKPAERAYRFEVHVRNHPEAVKLDDETLTEYASMEEFEQAEEGWFYDPSDRQGTAYVKTLSLATDTPFEIGIDIPVKIGELKKSEDLRIFPNPTKGSFTIYYAKADLRSVNMYDMGGNLIGDNYPVNIEGNTARVEMQDLNEGVYILEIDTEYGLLRDKLVYRK
ncbi:MAG TPA: DUF5110 domain-containing protein, partial [Bacteroidales bacterium]|nr:DUF5110 domain-containing protein [Bacteroidales bacterium]